MKNSSKCSHSSTSVLTAVALQDHLAKSLSLQDPVKKQHNNTSHTSQQKIYPSKKSVQKKSKIGAKNKKDKKFDEEYVIGPKPKPLTLAQKLGLIPSPPCRLTDQEWQKVKYKSNERKDSAEPCVICKEEYGTLDQVLLSCSHVFHRVCLEAFERFSGGKSCPMCRKEQYEKRVIHEGRKLRQYKCATKIQATWRGYVVRCWYRKLRETVPPNDPKLRKKFYEEKLHFITDRFVNSIENSEVDTLLSQIDQSIEDSRRVMSLVGEDCFKTLTDADWDQVKERAKDRFSDCPICFTSFCQNDHDLQDTEPNSKGQRPMVLLSCSHVFHKKCLQAFEELSFNSANICPVCRSPYYKKNL